MLIRISRQCSILKTWYYTNQLTSINTVKMIHRTFSQSDKKNNDIPTMTELKDKLAKLMGVGSKYNPFEMDRQNLSQYLPKSQKDLPPRSMEDSFLLSTIPLSTDETLQDKYTTFLGHVRVGRLLEDMDLFAVVVAHKHILDPKLPEGIPKPQTLVTALVDRIDFTDFVPKAHEDIKISGHVCWVGVSTMEVVVWLEQKLNNEWNRITRAIFVIAARDPTKTKSCPVNPILPANDKEKKIFEGGENRKQNRILVQKAALSKVIPNNEEQELIHDLYLKTKTDNHVDMKIQTLPSKCVWMEDCTASSIVFSEPENRNLHNTVFGGFIMRQATELSWILGYKFSKYRPLLRGISDINFTKPIAVNSLIQMHAFVVYTQMQFIQITVYVEVFDPHTGQSDTTNTFHFTYEVPHLVLNVTPRTYHEAMMFIDGRRHFFKVMKNHPRIKSELEYEEILYHTCKL